MSKTTDSTPPEHRTDENILLTLARRTAGFTGEDYFRELAKYITATLGVRYAIVTECVDDEKTRVRTLSYVDRQELQESFEYAIKGTPCEIVMEGHDYFCPVSLQKYFSTEDQGGIESYLGVPIYSPSTGEIIGHIAAYDSAPMISEQNQTAILKIFASRAGAEIDRLHAWKKLEIANQELRIRVLEIESLKNQLQAENKYLQEEIKLNNNFDEIVSKSERFHRVLQQIEQVASTDATVLILGESGTGKELIARAIHNISLRTRKPLVKVNCATLPANLIESELFGHERGAFTGALERKIGRFELADGGTIFLDEIGELPVELQAKLLRVLQEGEFERLGNPRTMKVNVRVIAATNRNLQQAIGKKEFREDLYYRLNVFPVNCLPLRDRKEDIPLLVKHFCLKHAVKIGKRITTIPVRVMAALEAYDWPGNIRELENIIERALILSRNGVLEAGEWLPAAGASLGTGAVGTIGGAGGITAGIGMAGAVGTAGTAGAGGVRAAGGPGMDAAGRAGTAAAAVTLGDVEKNHILEVLQKTGWKVSGEKGAAKILGLNPTTLEARMKKLGIKRG